MIVFGLVAIGLCGLLWIFDCVCSSLEDGQQYPEEKSEPDQKSEAKP